MFKSHQKHFRPWDSSRPLLVPSFRYLLRSVIPLVRPLSQGSLQVFFLTDLFGPTSAAGPLALFPGDDLPFRLWLCALKLRGEGAPAFLSSSSHGSVWCRNQSLSPLCVDWTQRIKTPNCYSEFFDKMKSLKGIFIH